MLLVLLVIFYNIPCYLLKSVPAFYQPEYKDNNDTQAYNEISPYSIPQFAEDNSYADYMDGTFPPGDTPDPNVQYSSAGYVYDLNETTEDNEIVHELQFTKILLNGTADDVRKIDRNSVVRALPDINKVQISLNKKLIIWEIVKGNKSVETFTRADLERTGDILLCIPELDLFNLNYSDWKIIDYLGTLEGLGRRRAGIIGFAMKRRWGEDIFKKIETINQLKGLICAFSPNDLMKISTTTFLNIGRDVFENIRPCTKRQLQVLLHIAMSPTAYGPPQAWNTNDTSKLALLLKAMKAADLKTIRPEAMEGIDYATIEAMGEEQLEVFDEKQLSYLSDVSLAAYRRLTGIDSNSNQNMLLFTNYLIFLTSSLICYYIRQNSFFLDTAIIM